LGGSGYEFGVNFFALESGNGKYLYVSVIEVSAGKNVEVGSPTRRDDMKSQVAGVNALEVSGAVNAELYSFSSEWKRVDDKIAEGLHLG
jgi:hypothetical protein